MVYLCIFVTSKQGFLHLSVMNTRIDVVGNADRETATHAAA